LLSRSSSFLSHSKSENLLRTLDSLTRKTGRFVYNNRGWWKQEEREVIDLQTALVVGIALARHAVRDRVDDLNTKIELNPKLGLLIWPTSISRKLAGTA
jgi:hypothetical protein